MFGLFSKKASKKQVLGDKLCALNKKGLYCEFEHIGKGGAKAIIIDKDNKVVGEIVGKNFEDTAVKVISKYT